MATKKAKTAQKTSSEQTQVCPDCGAGIRAVKFAGAGKRGMFWVCEKGCGYTQRTK